jgi:hypothetical protein
MNSIPLLAPVALVVDIPGTSLTRGQVGTAVEHVERNGEPAVLVEFSDADGQTYALQALRPEQVLVLHGHTEAA